MIRTLKNLAWIIARGAAKKMILMLTKVIISLLTSTTGGIEIKIND